MALSSNTIEKVNTRISSLAKRFFRWITTPHILLSLIMLILMVYLIIIPLVRMLNTTLTFQEKDVITSYSIHYTKLYEEKEVKAKKDNDLAL